MAKIVVYTGLFGGYDELQPPVPQSIEADWVCLSDVPGEPVGFWRREVLELPFPNPRLQARYVKTHPIELLPAHDWSVWIDANIAVVSSTFVEEAVRLAAGSGADVLTMPHPTRNCLYDEAQACGLQGKADPGILQRQVRHYRVEGFPERKGLFATCMIVRTSNPRVSALGAAWFRECSAESSRDQISLPFVAWRLGMQIASTPFSPSEPVSLSNRLTIASQRNVRLHRMARRFLRAVAALPGGSALAYTPSRTAQRNRWFSINPHAGGVKRERGSTQT